MSHLVKSATVVLGLLASPASAQDWGGLYGGLTLSMSNVTADHSFSNDAPSDTVTLTDGWPGLFLGYNIQRGNLVAPDCGQPPRQAAKILFSLSNLCG